jgi:RNA polymerase sigma factor (TIGR02999 family)
LGGKAPAAEEASITRLLRDWNQADAESAGRVISAVYSELRVMSSRLLGAERPGHTLQPTALVHELFLRLSDAQPPSWRDRAHFFAVAATTLRRILIDHARANGAARRGGGGQKVPLEQADPGVTCSYEDLLSIDEALTALEEAEPRAARVSELRLFAGLEEKEIAEQLGVSEITVKRDWKFARAWLATYLGPRDRRSPSAGA